MFFFCYPIDGMAFYRIKEAAEKIGVMPHVLRFWESQFTHLKPNKTGRGQRMYEDKDISQFMKIKHLLYSEGYSIPGAKRHLKESKSKGSHDKNYRGNPELRPFLKDMRNNLQELNDYLKSI